MKLIRGMHNLSALRQADPRYRCVLTIGSFDGVHLGHQAVLRAVRAKADVLRLPAWVMIFEPQPQEVVAADRAPARLTPFHEKVPLLIEQGMDGVVCLKFDEKLRHMLAQDFIEQVLVNALGVSHLVVGDDFRFGYQLGGNFALLQQYAKRYDYQVSNMHTLTQDNQRISSTRIREALAASDFALAEQLLSRPYSLSGRVIYGRQLGRKLGVSTANIRIKARRVPIQGVFAVAVARRNPDGRNQWLKGVANVGIRPTLGGTSLLLEVHLLDFDQDLYGEKLRVVFRHKIRAERQFADLQQLAQQLQKDIVEARNYFSRVPGS